MVVLKSGPHPEAYVYKQSLPRLASSEYKSSAPEDYARHFTVMFYTNHTVLGVLLAPLSVSLSLSPPACVSNANSALTDVPPEEFLKNFEAKYGADKWGIVQQVRFAESCLYLSFLIYSSLPSVRIMA